MGVFVCTRVQVGKEGRISGLAAGCHLDQTRPRREAAAWECSYLPNLHRRLLKHLRPPAQIYFSLHIGEHGKLNDKSVPMESQSMSA